MKQPSVSSDKLAVKKYRKHPSLKIKREWLDLHFTKSISVKSIADDYGYPVATVYRVLEKLDPNKKERSDKGKPKKSPTISIDLDKLAMEGESYETQLEILFQEIMNGIGAKKNLQIGKALVYANQLTNSLKKLRSVQFGQMAKNLDAKIVERIIRRYEPNATALRVIEIMKEVIAEAKAANAAGSKAA